MLVDYYMEASQVAPDFMTYIVYKNEAEISTLLLTLKCVAIYS